MSTARECRRKPFIMTDGNNTYSVFAIEGGVVKIVNAKISQANIDNLVVGTSNIEPGAVTAFYNVDGGSSGSTSWSYFNLTVPHGLGSPKVKLEWKLKYSAFAGSAASGLWEVQCVTDSNAVLDSGSHKDPFNQTTSTTLYIPPADRAETVFRIGTIVGGNSYSQRLLFAYVFKR